MAAIDVLLKHMVGMRASDLHLSSGRVPMARVFGDMVPVAGMPPLETEILDKVISEAMPERIRAQFATENDVDFSYCVEGIGRFRCNVFYDHEGICGAFRYIPERVLGFEDLDLPDAIRGLCDLEDGLVLVTGPTGCGKTSTLTALIDHINRTRSEHIVTIEDPVEYIHKSIRSLVNQREVYTHTRSFSRALRAALREDPDIVLVGEMRDLETVETALETAETGHLVFSTLHTAGAVSAVDRIVDQFPAEKQMQIRTMLASTLRAVLAQTLLKRRDGKGRMLAVELLMVTSAVAANIRDGKTHLIQNSLQTGGKFGMIPMNESIVKLVKEGKVAANEAYLRASDRPDLERRLVAEGIPFSNAPDAGSRSGRAEAGSRTVPAH